MFKFSIAVIASFTAASVTMTADRSKGEAKLREIVVGRVAGTPVRCLTLLQFQSSYVIDGTAIVYEGAGSQIWVNRPSRGAEMLSDGDTLVITSRSGLLCDIEPVDLIDRNSRQSNGFVTLGRFVPYVKVAVPTDK